MKEVALIIPALNPNDQLLYLVRELKHDIPNIIVVNDGSSQAYQDIFNNLTKLGIKVLTHHTNLGKGQALKYAINEVLINYPQIEIIVTADADGQHSPKDIKKVAIESTKHPMSIILGTRDFRSKNTPIRNKMGNRITSFIFKYLIGLNVNDTQTGLRAFNKETANQLLKVSGERFNYETNVLIYAKQTKIDIFEVPIETIYLDKNSSSHYRVLIDSFAIYQTFAKYLLNAGSSFAIDLILFTIFYQILKEQPLAIIMATIFARIISSIYNYLINAKFIFPSNPDQKSIVKYYALVIMMMIFSAIMVSIIHLIFPTINPSFIKIMIDLIIFVTNFYLLREWVFKNNQ